MAAAHLADTLLTKVAEEGHHASAKVTVVGTGQVGMAAAFAMMTQVSSILLIIFKVATTMHNILHKRFPSIS